MTKHTRSHAAAANAATLRLPSDMTVATTSQAATAEATARPSESHLLTDALLLLMAIIWGVNFSVLKYATTFLAPLAFNGVRIPTAAAAQFGLARAMRLPSVPPAIVRRLILLGMLGNGVYQVLFILGVVRSLVATTALLVAVTPAYMAILGRLFGREQLSRRNWTGIACQIAGCATVVLGSARSADGRDSLSGVAMLLAGSLSWAIYSVILRRYSDQVHVVQIGGYTMIGGAIVNCTLALPFMIRTDWTALPAGVWLALLYSSLLAMVAAYLFWYRGLRVLGPTRTAVYSNLQPIIAGLVAFLVLREIPTGPQYVGAALIIAGLLLTRR